MATIRKRGNNYQISVCTGRDENNNPIRKSTTFKPDPNKTERQNQKALERFAIEYEDKVTTGKLLDGEKLTYKEYSKLWLKNYAEKQMKETSVERCENSLDNLIIPELGHLKLAKIQPLQLQDFYNKLLKTGYTINGEHKEYKANTIKRIHQIISSSLNTAVQWQLIESNPCNRIKPPKADRTAADIKHFTLEEAQTFIAYLDKEYVTSSGGRQKKDGSASERHYVTRKVPLQQKVFFHLALFGGFRLGELVALTWEDVDFENNCISITKSTAKTNNGQITTTPKTRSSIRLVSMPTDTMLLLKKYKLEQNTYKLSVGSYWKGKGHLFTQEDGSQMNISTPNHAFKKILRRYNQSAEEKDRLPEITLHGLRHTSATLLIAQNLDVRTVSGRLGHAETSTTLNIYAHALKKQDETAAASLGNLFSKKA